jgi:DNA-binding PadR family transcriptional regulator
MLGKLEEEVLLAALQAGPKSLPSEVYARIEAVADGRKSPAFGAVYTTLTRMVTKGLLELSNKTDQAGRDRRAFTVTAAGKRAVQASMSRVAALGGLRWAEA